MRQATMQRAARPWAVAAAVLLVFAFTTPVQATSHVPGGPGGPHCVISLHPLGTGETQSRVEWTRCFPTFADAIAAATGGAVHLKSGVGPTNVTPDMLAVPTGAAGQAVLSIDYQDSNYGGSTWTATSDNDFGCNGGRNYASPSMPPTWDNVVSSAKVFSSCDRFIHWENQSYTGANVDCSPCSYVGDAMNDRTSSEEWFDT